MIGYAQIALPESLKAIYQCSLDFSEEIAKYDLVFESAKQKEASFFVKTLQYLKYTLCYNLVFVLASLMIVSSLAYYLNTLRAVREQKNILEKLKNDENEVVTICL